MEAFARSVFFNPAGNDATGTETANRDLCIQTLSGWIADIHAGRSETLTPDDARKLAIGVSAVIDGISLERSLNPVGMTAAEALQIALDIIGPKIGVVFAFPDGAA